MPRLVWQGLMKKSKLLQRLNVFSSNRSCQPSANFEGVFFK